MTESTSEGAFRIHLALADYPILKDRIRGEMRRRLFESGIITLKEFETQVRQKAINTQRREGITDPLSDESGEVWALRIDRVRRSLTDAYFAQNYPYEVFEDILNSVLAKRQPPGSILSSFNPELAPQEVLFEQARVIEALPPEELSHYKHHHNELIVVLIRRIISDQLAYINIAKEWFTASDLIDIQQRKIGYGRIGGKAAGMLLACTILRQAGDEAILRSLKTPESYFVGADVMYDFMSFNELFHWSDQKYKTQEQIHADYPLIQTEFRKGEFPADIIDKFQELLEQVGNQPLIVRSSSLLEDNFGMSFAGKYESVFCPNQGTPQSNLKDLLLAITQVYASVLNPDALLYRRSMKLQDYDERVALLIQVIEGERWGKFYFPHAAGVGFSRNIYRWSPQIHPEDGFLRLVWGLGTRAVDRVGNDYPRLVALSHPLLRPKSSTDAIQRYSQQHIDLIDLESNTFESLPITDVLTKRYPLLRYIAQLNRDGYLATIRSTFFEGGIDQLVITLESLLSRTPLSNRMRSILTLLEAKYQRPVDTEFTVYISEPQSPEPEIKITILQCRPQSQAERREVRLPENLPAEDILFSTRWMVPHGHLRDIQYVLYVLPEAYFALPTPAARSELGRAIGRLNQVLADKNFVCIGPGRWGTSNPDLGVNIGYADIYNTRALIELAGDEIGPEPEPSFGTHFFQDLVEAHIFPLAIYLDDRETVFNLDFFHNAPNQLMTFQPNDVALADCLRVIEVPTYRAGHLLEIVMDSERSQAVGFLQEKGRTIA
jgi:hypothetical protein